MRWIFFTFLFLPFLNFAQLPLVSPDIKWSAFVGGNRNEELNKVTQLANGNIIGIGYTNSIIQKKEDQYICIYDTTGKRIMQTSYGSLLNDKALGLTATFDGNFVYCGFITPSENTTINSPFIRKLGPDGNVIWSHINKVSGSYKDLIELTPFHYIVIGDELDRSVISFYHNDSLIRKQKIEPPSVSLTSISKLSDHDFIVCGLSKPDNVLWFARINDEGKMVWTKKATKGFKEGQSIIIETNEIVWIAGQYYDSKKREDAYLLKIDSKNGNQLAKYNYGGKYNDYLYSAVKMNNGNFVLGGKTFSHIKAGARRSKAWLFEVSPQTGKIIQDQFIWGGKQNEVIKSIFASSHGNLITGGSSSSGEALGQDGWLLDISLHSSEKNVSFAEIKFKDIELLDENGDGKIGFSEASTFKLEYDPSGEIYTAFPRVAMYLDGINMYSQVLETKIENTNAVYIPFFRSSSVSGMHEIKMVLLNSNNERKDSISKSFEFLPKEAIVIETQFEMANVQPKLINGQLIINIPISFASKGSIKQREIKVGIQGLEYIDHSLSDSILSFDKTDQQQSILSIRPSEIISQDSLLIKVSVSGKELINTQQTWIPIGSWMKPWVQARKEQTSILLAQKLQSGTLAPLLTTDYEKLPLDSFFLKSKAWSVENGEILNKNNFVDPEKIFLIWIEPDPVISRNYFISKRNSFTALIKLINQENNSNALTPRLIIQRQKTGVADTVDISLEQGVMLGSYQFNIQSEILLEEGENKVKLTLWEQGRLIKTSSTMVIKYELPRSNLFVYAFGVSDPTLPLNTKDADDLGNAFGSQSGKLYDEIHTSVFNTPELTNTQAIKTKLRSIVNDYFIFKRIKKDDVLLIYFSSHGSLIRNQLHLHAADYDPLLEEETTIDFISDVQDKLKDIPSKKIFLIDACHSGAASLAGEKSADIKGDPIDQSIANAVVQLSKASNDFYYVLSSSSDEYSYSDPSWGNSAFTKAILEALKNKSEKTLDGEIMADQDHNKILDLNELYLFLQQRVPVIIQSKKDLKSSQTPYSPDPGKLKSIPLILLEK